MKLFSYVVARDFGFAPNPFYGYCTLATCKPQIRSAAKAGDWVIGTTPKSRGVPSLVFAMEVKEKLTFLEYWADNRFVKKRPDLSKSMKCAFGDNIYSQNPRGDWVQLDSHHTYSHGAPCIENILKDTSSDNVLIADRYWYWGSNAVPIPRQFIDGNISISAHTQGHLSNKLSPIAHDVVRWIHSQGDGGVLGRPASW